MTLTIIAGTHTFVDLTGKFRLAWARSQQKRIFYEIDGIKFTKYRFDRVEIGKNGEIIRHPRLINPVDHNFYRWTVNQPTGSCKTVLAVYDLWKTYLRGGNVAANFAFQYMPHNIGRDKDEWTPNLTSIEDLVKANNIKLVIDDIKGTADNWQAEESDIISMAANLGRKDKVDIDITTQGVTNFVAPNIRRVTSGYEIPYCTIRDQRLPSPDGKGYPRLIECISLIPGDMQIGDIFVGFGVLNGDIPDGKQITPSQNLLNSYKSMEIATGLKVNGVAVGSNAPGWALECKAEDYLKSVLLGTEIKHPKGKIFDLYTQTHVFDVIGTNEDGNGYTQHKTWAKHIGSARRTNKIPYLMFQWGDGWGFIRIKPDLPEGQLLNFADSSIYNRIRTIDSLKVNGVSTVQIVRVP